MNFYLQVSNQVELRLKKIYLEQGTPDRGFGEYLPDGSFFWTTWLILSVLLLMENSLNNCSVFVKVKKRLVWFLYGHPRVWNDSKFIRSVTFFDCFRLILSE